MDAVKQLQSCASEICDAQFSLQKSYSEEEVDNAKRVIRTTNETLVDVQKHAKDTIDELEKLRITAAEFMKLVPVLINQHLGEMIKETPSFMNEQNSELAIGYGTYTPRNKTTDDAKQKRLQQMNELMAMAKQQSNILDTIIETEKEMAKITAHDETMGPIVQNLQSHLKQWTDKVDDFQTYKQRMKDEEKRHKEEKERKEKEEKERKERERKEKEEKERKEREEEERKREEERRRKEEEERRRKEEERRRKEEEEIQRRKEEEKRRKEKEEKRKRKEEEKRKRREEEKRLKDPTNWNRFIYYRTGKKSGIVKESPNSEDVYHTGVAVVILAMPGTIKKGDIVCTTTDDDKEIQKQVGDSDDALISSLITVTSKSNIKLKYPLRVHIPYQKIPDTFVPRLKIACDTYSFVTPSEIPTATFEETPGTVYIGCEANNFSSLKLYACTAKKPRCLSYTGQKLQTEISGNRGMQMVVHESVNRDPLMLSLEDNNVVDSDFLHAQKMHPELEKVSMATCFVTINVPSSTQLHIDIEADKPHEGLVVQCAIRSDGAPWKCINPKTTDRKEVYTLPGNTRQNDFVAFNVKEKLTDDETIKAAQAFTRHSNEDIVRLILAQTWTYPFDIELQCVKEEDTENILKEFRKAGPAQKSTVFSMVDRETINIRFTGNIVYSGQKGTYGTIPIVYHRFNKPTTLKLRLEKTKTRQMSSMIEGKGYLMWNVSDQGHTKDRDGLYAIDIEKKKKTSAKLEWDDVGLTKFAARTLAEDEAIDWRETFTMLAPFLSNDIDSMVIGHDRGTRARTIEYFIQEWMTYEGKSRRVDLLIRCLEACSITTAANEINSFMTNYIAFFNDKSIATLSQHMGKEYRLFGVLLGITHSALEQIESENKDREKRISAMLSKIKTNDVIIENGKDLKNFLIRNARTSIANKEVLDFISQKLTS